MWRFYDRKLRNAIKGKNFNYTGQTFKAKVVDIYDGDTITVVFRYKGELQQHRCRMLGYDSPEMKPLRSKKNRDLEIVKAKEAQKALADLIDNKLVRIACHDFDKYGRLLIDMYVGHPFAFRLRFWKGNYIWTNQWMIDNGYGYAYQGGTKQVINYDDNDS
jgi:endonuclease YncB( thermonuclease family)